VLFVVCRDWLRVCRDALCSLVCAAVRATCDMCVRVPQVSLSEFDQTLREGKENRMLESLALCVVERSLVGIRTLTSCAQIR
jgi:hypothetical protein